MKKQILGTILCAATLTCMNLPAMAESVPNNTIPVQAEEQAAPKFTTRSINKSSNIGVFNTKAHAIKNIGLWSASDRRDHDAIKLEIRNPSDKYVVEFYISSVKKWTYNRSDNRDFTFTNLSPNDVYEIRIKNPNKNSSHCVSLDYHVYSYNK